MQLLHAVMVGIGIGVEVLQSQKLGWERRTNRVMSTVLPRRRDRKYLAYLVL